MKTSAQKIIDLAVRKKCTIKRFKDPRKIRFTNKFTTVNAMLFEYGTWVGFDDDRTGMSGNDPVAAFLHTLKKLLSRKEPFNC